MSSYYVISLSEKTDIDTLFTPADEVTFTEGSNHYVIKQHFDALHAENNYDSDFQGFFGQDVATFFAAKALLSSRSFLKHSNQNIDEVTLPPEPRVFRGLNTERASNSTVTVKAGKVTSQSGHEVLELSSDITFDITTDLDTGSEAANTWYYLWLIKEFEEGVVSVIGSTSNTNPTMPHADGVYEKALIGCFRNNGSSNIRNFVCRGSGYSKKYVWQTAIDTVSNGNATNITPINCTAVVPNMPDGYPFITISAEYNANSLLIYNANETSSYANLSGDIQGLSHTFQQFTTSIEGVTLSSTGTFGYRGSAGSPGVFIKILCFDLEL